MACLDPPIVLQDGPGHRPAKGVTRQACLGNREAADARTGGAHVVLHEVVDGVDVGGRPARRGGAEVDGAGAGQAPSAR